MRQELRKLVFDSLHNLSHSGISASVKMMIGVLMAKNEQINKKQKQKKTWCKECQHCQKAKITKHKKSKIQPFDLSIVFKQCTWI